MDFDIGAEPIEAFRIFRLNSKDSTLISFGVSDIWLPGEVKQSICNHAKSHGPLKPETNCTCGIWAVKSRRSINHAYPGIARTQARVAHLNGLFSIRGHHLLSSRVLLWGRVIEHEYGYRAEYAKIIGESLQWWPRKPYTYNPKRLQYIRQKYA